MCEIFAPNSAASLREDQCVEPSVGLRLVVRQHTGFDSVRHFAALTPCMTREHSGQAVGFKSLAPPIDVTVTAVEFATNLRPRMAVGQEQDQPSATRRICSPFPRRCLLLKFHSFALGQFHRALRERNDTAVVNVTVH